MKAIVHTDHLKLRLKVREIPEQYPDIILENPEQKYYDFLEKTFIYVKKLDYNGRIRNMMIACQENGDEVAIITIHPMTEEKIISRVVRGRWTKIE